MSDTATNGEIKPETQDESQKLFQEFLQKCCEVGQMRFQLDQLDGQKREMEKNLEVAERAVKSVANKHKESLKLNLSQKAQEPAPTEPKLEMNH